MIGTTFASYVRLKTRTNTNTLPDSELVIYANAVKDRLAGLIATNVDENYFAVEMTRDLEAGVRDYTFEEAFLKNSRYVSAKLDGTTAVYLRENNLSEADFFRVALLEETQVVSHYMGRKPEYIIFGRSLRILSEQPIITVTDGLKVAGEVYPEDILAADLASSSDLSVPSADIQHRLPRAAHDAWAKMVVIDYKTTREKPLPLTQEDAKLELDLSELYKTLRKRNAARSVIAKVPPDDGQGY